MNMLLREAISFPVLDQAVEWAKRRSRILGTMQIVRKEDDDLFIVLTWEPKKSIDGDEVVFSKPFYLN
jgi:hypothetical protein